MNEDAKLEKIIQKQLDSPIRQRILNFITFVIVDQILMAYNTGQNELHDGLLMLKEKPSEMVEILFWVASNIRYIKDIEDIMSKDLYDIVLDGINIEYQKYYTSNNTIEFEKYCRQKYYDKWLEESENEEN